MTNADMAIHEMTVGDPVLIYGAGDRYVEFMVWKEDNYWPCYYAGREAVHAWMVARRSTGTVEEVLAHAEDIRPKYRGKLGRYRREAYTNGAEVAAEEWCGATWEQYMDEFGEGDDR